MKIAKPAIILLILLSFSACNKSVNINDVSLHRINDHYELRDQVNKRKIASFKSADIAIQFAIDKMESGGNIELGAGSFDLKNTIYLKDRINIKGKGTSTVLKVFSTDTSGVAIIGTDLKQVQVSGFSLIANDTINSIAGIRYIHCGDSEISDVYSEGFLKYGIWLSNNSFLCHINNCTAADNGRANIFTDSLFWSRAGEYMPNLITNCITYGGWNGIETNKSIVLNIVGCIVHQPENYGFYIHNVSNSVILSGCRTYQSGNDGVVVEKSHEINITGNIFCWSRGKGIVMRGVDWGTVSGNNIIDSGSERYGGFPGVGEAIGIELTENCRCLQVTGNNIFNWGGQGIMQYAVYEDESCSNNLFSSLNINYFEKDAIFSKGKGSEVMNIIEQKDPPLHGKPSGPDPLFIPQRLQDFIDE